MLLKPKLPWQPFVQRALFGAGCVVILWHTLIAAPWLFHALGRAGAAPSASALIRPFYLTQLVLLALALLLERLTVRNISRLMLMAGGLMTIFFDWKVMQHMTAIREQTGLADEASRRAWGMGHAASFGLTALMLLIFAVLYFKSRVFEQVGGTPPPQGTANG